MSVLKMQVIGYLGRDAEVRDISPDRKVISFSVAHSEKFTDRNGQQQESTTWVNCSQFRPADKVGVAQYLTKGTLVCVEGKPDVRGYLKSDGSQGVSLELNVRELQLLGGGRREEVTASTTRAVEAKPATQEEEEDLPF